MQHIPKKIKIKRENTAQSFETDGVKYVAAEQLLVVGVRLYTCTCAVK